MKTIVAGSRSLNDYMIVKESLDWFIQYENAWDITEIVSGTARGIDRLGERYGKENNIPVKRFPANWDKYGKSAGYRRNVEMAKYADALFAFYDGMSKGTQHMLDIAKKEKLKVYRLLITK